MATTTDPSATPARIFTLALFFSVLMSMGLTAYLIYTYVPRYQASALVMIEDSAPYIAFNGSNRVGNTRKYIETQKELLRSPIVLEPVLSRKGVAMLDEFVQSTDSMKVIQKNLRIDRIGQSELYQVSYTSKSPQAAMAVSNAIIAEYLAIQSDEEFLRTQRVIDILEQERLRRSMDVERLRKKVVDLSKDVTGRDPFATNSILDLERATNSSTTLFQELAQLDVEQELLEAELAAAKSSNLDTANHDRKSGLLDLEITTAIADHPTVMETEQAIAELQSSIAEMETLQEPGKEDPAWKQLSESVQQFETTWSKIKTEVKEQVLSKRSKLHDLSQQERLATLQLRLDQLLIKREVLTKKLEKSVAELKKNGGKSIELEFARAELEREEKVFELIASRKLAMQTEMRAPTRVRLRRPASKPQTPINKFPYNPWMLGCITIFAATFAVAFLYYLLSRDSMANVAPEVEALG